MPRIKKGQHTPLNVTQEAQHRIFVGLGWNPNQKSGLRSILAEKLQRKKNDHDLDLTALLYDENRNLLEIISAKDGEHVGASGKIYHSGDNVKGVGDGDDEQISVELKDLPTNINHILFKVSIQSGQSFDEINAPEIRLTDAYSHHNFLQISLQEQDNAQHSIFIFAHLYRNKNKDWIAHNVSEFLNTRTLKNKQETLKAFLVKEDR